MGSDPLGLRDDALSASMILAGFVPASITGTSGASDYTTGITVFAPSPSPGQSTATHCSRSAMWAGPEELMCVFAAPPHRPEPAPRAANAAHWARHRRRRIRQTAKCQRL
jgi:hypothetical protein